MLVRLQRFDIADAKLEIAKPDRRRSLARHRKHPGRLVDRDDDAGRPNPSCRANRGLTDPGGEVGHAMARAHGGEFNQAVADMLSGAFEGAPPLLPS